MEKIIDLLLCPRIAKTELSVRITEIYREEKFMINKFTNNAPKEPGFVEKMANFVSAHDSIKTLSPQFCNLIITSRL